MACIHPRRYLVPIMATMVVANQSAASNSRRGIQLCGDFRSS